VGPKIHKLETKEMRVNPSTNMELTNGSATEQVQPFIYLGGIFAQLYPVWKNNNILELKVGCLIQILNQFYCAGVKRGK